MKPCTFCGYTERNGNAPFVPVNPWADLEVLPAVLFVVGVVVLAVIGRKRP
jgi:hypothetical protein